MNHSTPIPSLSAHVLVVDDEPDLLTLYELALLRAGHQVETAASLADARASLQQRQFDLLITDMRLPDGLGIELLRELTQQQRSEKAIVITAYGSAESAVEALKAGAFDYLTKPLDLKQFRAVVAAALQAPQTSAAIPNATAASGRTAGGSGTVGASGKAGRGLEKPHASRLLGQSAAIQQVKDRIAKVATSMAPVMILGESGTGKELVARAIHEASHRCNGPFIAVNCSAIPDALLEAEFFGARKGAYTGATADRMGYFAAAKGGTLFLDEIGDLPLAMQAKLLRVLQERLVRPLGGVQEEAVDVRILCATHKDLNAAVEKGDFRQDLYYRLNVIDIRIPPLRERREDLAVLATGLLDRLCQDHGQPPTHLTPAAHAWLQQHPFLGNVRELENILHRALALCLGQVIDVDVLEDGCTWSPPAPAALATKFESLAPISTSSAPALPTPAPPAPLPSDLQAYLDDIEKNVLIQALQATKGHRTAAANLLGLNLRQIRYRIARLNIAVPGTEVHEDDSTSHA